MSLTTTLLASLAGLTGATQVLAARREARAAKLTPPRGADVEVDGVRVHVEVLGQPEGSAPNLVLIHGSSGNTRDFTHRLAADLAPRYRLYIVDRPGMGWSDPHPDGTSLTTQSRLIQSAVAQLGATNPIVLGQSYGGAVALAWAATLPGTLAAVVSVSGVVYPWPTGLGPFYTLLSSWFGRTVLIPLITAWTPRALIKQQIDSVFAPQSAPDGYDDHFGPELTVRRSQLRVNALQRRALLSEIETLSPRWTEITVPIEVVHGDADSIVDHDLHAVGLARTHPGVTHIRTLPGIGHMPHHVARPEIVDAIDRAALRANVK